MNSIPSLESPYECLFDDASDSGLSLPQHLQAIYGSDWALPQPEGRTYTYSNFVVSHDGRISFNEPGHYGGDAVSGHNAHDTWLMALLRARADAIIVGDTTLKLEPTHIWTHQFIFPDTMELFHELRRSEGRSRYPLQVFLSLDGAINWDAAVLASNEYDVVIATTHDGAARIDRERPEASRVEVISKNCNTVDLQELESELRRRYSVRSLLVEGGPSAYGSAIAARIIDEEFLTLSPLVVGNDRNAGKNRPGLLEGLAFSPGSAIRMAPLSVRRNGDYLFVRSRVIYPDERL